MAGDVLALALVRAVVLAHVGDHAAAAAARGAPGAGLGGLERGSDPVHLGIGRIHRLEDATRIDRPFSCSAEPPAMLGLDVAGAGAEGAGEEQQEEK